MYDKERKLNVLAQIYKKTKEREDLECAAFSIIKEGDIDRGQWIHKLIANFSKEVMTVFDGVPMTIESQLADMWDCQTFEDKNTGLSMSWGEWSTFFSNDVSFRVYDRLVEERKYYQRMEAELAKAKAEVREATERIKQIQMIVQND